MIRRVIVVLGDQLVRRALKRWILVVACLAIGDLLAAHHAAAGWTVTLLQPAGYGNSQAIGTADGSQVGWATAPGGTNGHAIMWNGASSFVDLNPSGHSESTAGATFGKQQVGQTDGHAALWDGTPSSFIDLNPVGFNSSEAVAIDGNYEVGDGYTLNPSEPGIRAILWNGTAGSAIDLSPGADLNHAFVADGISGNTQVGYEEVAGGEAGTIAAYRAILWHGTAASATDITPAGFYSAQAFGISGNSMVGSGSLTSNLSATHALLWTNNGTSVVDLNPTEFSSSYATAISGSLQVGAGTTSGGLHALVWTGSASSAVDLNQYIPPGFSYSTAQGVDSATGTIVGIVWDSTYSNYSAAMWTYTVPEPTGFVLAALAALIFIPLLLRRGGKV